MAKRTPNYNHPVRSKVSHGKFCDYCDCSSCQDGTWERCLNIQRYACEDGSFVCETCLFLDPWEDCGFPGEGCAEWNEKGSCPHRPRPLGANWERCVQKFH